MAINVNQQGSPPPTSECPKCGAKFLVQVPGDKFIRCKCLKCDYDTRINASDCYVVTAIFGQNSQEFLQVKRKCRKTFLMNPVLTLGWCIYQYYGPILACWARSSSFGFLICKKFVAQPIINTTDKKIAVSIFWMLYLLILSTIGILLFVPFFVICLLLKPFTK